MGQTELNLGLIAAWGGTLRLPRIVALAKAKELIMLGTRISAEEAAKIGLVNKVVPKAELQEETVALARKLADGPPVVLKLAKELLNSGTQVHSDAWLKMETEAFGVVLGTGDAKEGVSAFLSKRRPKFKGE